MFVRLSSSCATGPRAGIGRHGVSFGVHATRKKDTHTRAAGTRTLVSLNVIHETEKLLRVLQVSTEPKKFAEVLALHKYKLYRPETRVTPWIGCWTFCKEDQHALDALVRRVLSREVCRIAPG